jgi:hypothetical protein
MATELKTFTGSQFIGKPVLADIEFIPHLETINDFAATNGLKIFVTSSNRVLGIPVVNPNFPPSRMSNHFIGHAIDMNIQIGSTLYNSNALGNFSSLPAAIKAFITAIRNHPVLRWGGDFGGPWNTLLHRKAVMLEVLRVLGGFESSWDWNEGRDITNINSNTACTEEAGIFQCSGNSMNFDPSLKKLLKNVSGQTDCDTFIKVSKSNHKFAIEYCARLLRFTINHHGPVKRKEINSWLKPDAVKEFQGFLI